MGLLLKWLINVWISTTGKLLRFADYPWLQGPMGDDLLIGDGFYQSYAKASGLIIERDPAGGLVTDFGGLIPASDPNRSALLQAVSHFYEHTAQYKLEVWSQWYPPLPCLRVLHVFMDDFGDLRTDHIFTFLAARMLHLHYKIIRSV
jgi:hypothetical protein